MISALCCLMTIGPHTAHNKGVGVGFPPACRPPKKGHFCPPRGGPPGGVQKWPFLVRMPGIVHLLLPIISKNLSLIRGGPPGGAPGGAPQGGPPGGPPG